MRRHRKQSASLTGCAGVYLASIANKPVLFLFELRSRGSVAWHKQSIRAFGHPHRQAGERQKERESRGDERNAQAQLNSPSHLFDTGFPFLHWTKPLVRHSPRQRTPGSSRSFVHTERATVPFSVLSFGSCFVWVFRLAADLLAGDQPLINTPFQGLEFQ